MPIQPFGKADPVYDSLRVFSNQALEAGAGDGSTSTGGGLENKIYLWPGDGSSVSTFDPDEAGLTAALAAAVDGDTVTIPSIVIALTAGVIIPDGVAVVFMSRNSEWSFSGFEGVAVEMNVGSTLHFPKIVFAATGDDATGINAGADDCRVYDPDVEVSGGAVSNHAINAGQSVTASEIWQMIHRTGSGHSIVWSDTFDFNDAVNDTAWNVIESWPTGFDGTSPANDSFFVMPSDGSEFYIGSQAKIWRCTNVAAIRSNPATTPTYTAVMDAATPIGSGVPLTLVNMCWWKDRLCAIVRSTSPTLYFYGEYSGGAWTWTNQADGTTAFWYMTGERQSHATGASNNLSTLINALTLSQLFALNSGFGAGNTQPMWRNYSGDSEVRTLFKANAATTKIVDEGGATLHDTGLSVKSGSHVTGAILGPHSYVTMEDGELFVSADGASYSAGETWLAGMILDHNLNGGGSLIWIADAVADNAEFVHISLDDGASFDDKTGNFWSVIGSSAVGITFRGAALVY